jgi:hypothetical protein
MDNSSLHEMLNNIESKLNSKKIFFEMQKYLNKFSPYR